MSIIMFAMIGSIINPGAGYWIAFGFFCLFKFLKSLNDVLNN